MKEYRILGSKVTALTVDELHTVIKDTVEKNHKELILNTNVHGINLARKISWLRELRNSAKVVHCDGAGVIWGAKILGYHIPCRITYADWIWQLSEFCISENLTIYLLGAKLGIADVAAKKLQQRYPALKIVGTHHGHFDKKSSKEKEIIESINQLKPNILLVSFGMPIQEQWIKDNWQHIDANVFLAGGGCLDIISGTLPRCPQWMAKYDLEWLYLSFLRPKRFFSRYLIGNPKFILYTILEKIGIIKYEN